MSSDHTQAQSDDDRRHSQQLSRRRTRPPIEVPGYEARQFLGSGAYGEVWVAIDQNTGRRVAIKFYTHRGGVDWSLLSREVEKLVFLSADRYVVQLLDVGWDADPPYYVMDFIENGSLDERLAESGPLPVDEAVELFREVAIGLMHAHGKGVLHCDLKPANVLLDQDHKPRLADFGQSRLSHEQSPALGTLFYMAPEQADLEAVPDARWDVYALGALLYCMLTGQPPHRSQEAADQFDSARDLADRLARYRRFVRSAPIPGAHRQVHGIDSPLVEIIDRCLAIDPIERFPHIQGVLDALAQRERTRARRPLVVLGFVGPVLLLAIAAIFFGAGFRRAIGDSDRGVTARSLESNLFAAKYAAEVVAGDLERYFRAVEEVAADTEFVRLAAQTIDDPVIATLAGRLNDPAGVPEELDRVREQFLAHEARGPLQQRIEQIMQDPRNPAAASWFFMDADGLHMGAHFQRQPTLNPVGHNYAYRTYFHGGPIDLQRSVRPPDVDHIADTHLSAVFNSTASNTWKIAMSAPVYRGDRFLGVVAITVEMGNFVEFVGRNRQFAVLVDNRQGRHRGVILQHPLYNDVLREKDRLPETFSRHRVDLDDWDNADMLADYSDPLAEVPQGAAFGRRWLAARSPVQLKRRDAAGNGELTQIDTGLIVLVQEDYETATRSVHLLGKRLLRDGQLAMGLLVIIVMGLWCIVIRRLGAVSRRTAATSGNGLPSTPLHNMETVAAPRRPPKTNDPNL